MTTLLTCQDFWVLLAVIFGPALCVVGITVLLEDS